MPLPPDAEELVEICRVFVARVERGELHSKHTYEAMKAALRRLDRKPDYAGREFFDGADRDEEAMADDAS